MHRKFDQTAEEQRQKRIGVTKKNQELRRVEPPKRQKKVENQSKRYETKKK